MLFRVDLFFYQIISQFLLGSPICLPYRHKCFFWLIGPELSIIKYFPVIFSLICIKLSEILPKLIKFLLLKMTHHSHTFTFHRFPDMGFTKGKKIRNLNNISLWLSPLSLCSHLSTGTSPFSSHPYKLPANGSPGLLGDFIMAWSY